MRYILSLLIGVGFPTFVAKSAADEAKAAEAEAVRRLIRQLGSEDFEEREQAAKQLVARGSAVLDALEAARRAKDPEIARKAWECMRLIDPSLELKPQILACIKQLQSSDDAERKKAASILCALGPKLAPFVATLADGLDNPEIEVRLRTAVVLAHMGPKAEVALPKLLRILKDSSPPTNELRQQAMQVLVEMGPAGRQGVPILLHILETEGPEMQTHVVHHLGELGQDDARVGPALLKALSRGDLLDKSRAAFSLSLLQKEPEKAIPAIVQILMTHTFKGANEDDLERGLIESLQNYGASAEPAIPYLLQVIKNWKRKDVTVRRAALLTLICIGPAAHKVVPQLKDLGTAPSEEAISRLLTRLID